MKVAVVLPNWIGDVVMATPALKAIRESLSPGDELVGIMKPYVREVLAGSDLLDGEIFLEKKTKDRSHKFWPVVQQVKAEQFDSIVLLSNSLRTAALAWFAGITKRVGYARNWRGPMLTHHLPPLKENGKYVPISAVDSYLKLTELAGFKTVDRQTVAGTLPENDKTVNEYWNRFKLHGKRVIAMNSGGAYGVAKHWPAEHYVELGKRLLADPQNAVLLICGPGERETVAEIQQQINHPAAHSLATEQVSIGISKACIQRASVLVTTDSGPRHFAAAFQVPTVTMFGPTDPRWANNYNTAETVLFNKLDCGPCAKRSCPLKTHQCMKELGVDQVLAAVLQHLETGLIIAA
ncbi:MAG: lipopolysaccharide heptosyltransferase II [Blastopirellula sp.]|nr:MAG: lipopolysaccharide heptosyltransferase II [Blastopirellula sp.]